MDKKIGKFILGRNRDSSRMFINEEGSELIWVVNGSVRDICRIRRNVSLYDVLIQKVMSNTLFKKTLRSQLKKDDEERLKDMLKNQTEIEVLTKATEEEILENNKSWWQRFKEKFRKS